jgi:hypothetical protein
MSLPTKRERAEYGRAMLALLAVRDRRTHEAPTTHVGGDDRVGPEEGDTLRTWVVLLARTPEVHPEFGPSLTPQQLRIRRMLRAYERKRDVVGRQTPAKPTKNTTPSPRGQLWGIVQEMNARAAKRTPRVYARIIAAIAHRPTSA